LGSTDNGYSGLHRALKRDHGVTTRNFFEDVIDPNDEYDYPGNDQRTHQQIKNHLEALVDRKGYADSTIESKQSRLARIMEYREDIHASGDIITLGKQSTKNSFQKLVDIFDRLDEELESQQSKRNHQSDLISFFSYLERREIVDYNPATSLQEEYEWDYSSSNPVYILSEEQVKRIWEATRTREEKVIVILYIGHGLRTSEGPELTRENFVIQTKVPHIKLDDRKNQPGTIPLLVGKNYIADQLRASQTPGETADPLFPSSNANRDAVTEATIRRRFKKICSRADVTVGDKTPTPQNGRKTWYSMYIEVFEDLTKVADIVSSEQGSRNPQVVLNNYYPTSNELERYREEMKTKLNELLTGIQEEQPGTTFPDKNANSAPTISDFV